MEHPPSPANAPSPHAHPGPATYLGVFLVALFYMHLRYNSRWYAVLLLAGVFFAVLVGRFLPAVQK